MTYIEFLTSKDLTLEDQGLGYILDIREMSELLDEYASLKAEEAFNAKLSDLSDHICSSIAPQREDIRETIRQSINYFTNKK